ncbi:MAG: hypothetical protein J0G32_08080 [Alphaproteobacteria bacterium]|nr:hypothetical protein [Alphaproteobacteria bacterium]OJV11976.1 MAG: hypothetical protein BGO27_06380 [Alphaproteobacteria bacterium 33-17]
MSKSSEKNQSQNLNDFPIDSLTICKTYIINNDLKSLKKQYKKLSSNKKRLLLEENDFELLHLAILNNRTECTQWILKKAKNKNIFEEMLYSRKFCLFFNACKQQNSEFASIWVNHAKEHQIHQVVLEDYILQALKYACEHNHIEITKYLLNELSQTKANKQVITQALSEMHETAFFKNFDQITKLLDDFCKTLNFTIPTNHYILGLIEAFFDACEVGQLEMATDILDKAQSLGFSPNIFIEFKDFELYRQAENNQNLCLQKWIIELANKNNCTKFFDVIEKTIAKSWYNAIQKNDFDMAEKYLLYCLEIKLDIKKILSFDNYKYFYKLCDNGTTQSLDYIFKLYKFCDISTTFIIAIKNFKSFVSTFRFKRFDLMDKIFDIASIEMLERTLLCSQNAYVVQQACFTTDINLIKKIFEYVENVKVTEKIFENVSHNPLHITIEAGNHDNFQYVLNKAISYNADLKSILQYDNANIIKNAIRKQNTEIARNLCKLAEELGINNAQIFDFETLKTGLINESKKGNLDNVKWLYSKAKALNLHKAVLEADDLDIYIKACSHNNLHVAEWLTKRIAKYEIDKSLILKNSKIGFFEDACRDGNIGIITLYLNEFAYVPLIQEIWAKYNNSTLNLWVNKALDFEAANGINASLIYESFYKMPTTITFAESKIKKFPKSLALLASQSKLAPTYKQFKQMFKDCTQNPLFSDIKKTEYTYMQYPNEIRTEIGKFIGVDMSEAITWRETEIYKTHTNSQRNNLVQSA